MSRSTPQELAEFMRATYIPEWEEKRSLRYPFRKERRPKPNDMTYVDDDGNLRAKVRVDLLEKLIEAVSPTPPITEDEK